MLSLRNLRNRTAIGLAVVLQLAFSPAITTAQEAVPSTSATPAATQSAPVPSNYIYNPSTGLWENDKYVWDPVTLETKLKSQTAPAPTTPATIQPADTLAEPSVLSPNNTTAAPVSSTDTVQAVQQSTTGADVNNIITSTAQTGNATVLQNTSAGNATTGNALSTTQLVNNLQSAWNMQGGISTFTTNINGSITGDFVISPMLQGAAHTTSPSTALAVKTDVDNRIINNVVSSATSGNATVSSNTTAGDATSGDANALVNVISLINSTISTGSSFVGNVNIFGSLDGDILLPDSMMQALKGDHASIATIELDNSIDQSIINNVTTTATTGTADVSGNTTAGNATSGQAKTKLNVLNLTGSNVIGNNSLLVFVNVLGNWVGMIVNAPDGATSAALGDASLEQASLASADIDSSSSNTIINNIDVSATTGNASVTDNTHAGNATSGNATASANIANITHSNLSLADWFGILFINVFGTWHGSFGVDTEAGGWSTDQTASTGSLPPNQTIPSQAISQIKVFRLSSSSGRGHSAPPTSTTLAMANSESRELNVLAATDRHVLVSVQTSNKHKEPPRASGTGALTTGGILLASSILAIERYIHHRSRRSSL